MLSEKISTELNNSKISDPPILKRLGQPDIHMTLSNLNLDVRILFQGHWAVISSLSLFLTLHSTACNAQTFVNQARN